MGEQVAARLYGGVAQLGEHLPCKQGVKSSNLSISTWVRTSRIRMYLENCIQKKDTISLTQKIQDIRENQSPEMDETVTNAHNAIWAVKVG